MSNIFVFPGQGAQVVGMGAELYKNNTAARAVFDEVNVLLFVSRLRANLQ